MTFTMGDLVLYCPLCCNATFDSKQSLIEHISIISSNLVCPLCTNRFSSIDHFTDHLKLDNCELVNQVQTIIFETNTQIESNENSLENTKLKLESNENENNLQKNNLENQISTHTVKVSNGSEESKMYVELLGKQMLKPYLQTQELKLVKEDGESRYVILTDEDSVLNQGVSIVTKQNVDGTISLMALKDEEPETNPVEEDTNKNQDEIYSCNACGVSFSSVLEHIQNYHNDQDVVVEEPIEVNSIPLEYEEVANEEVLEDKQQSRRMITETGDIIETPLTEEQETVPNKPVKVVIPIKTDAVDKQGRACTRRYVQIDKFCNSIIKDIKPTDEKNGPYHNVVVKEMQTTSGNKMRVYNCMSCNVYVSSLSEFKLHPCKILKYHCPQCPVAYENSKSLCAHMKVHKSKGEYNYVAPVKFECEICTTIFPTSKSLKLHKRMHDPIKSRPIEPPVDTSDGNIASNNKFLCSICDKLIPIDYRTIHQNSHKGSNKMNCDICNKKFHSQEYLDMHMSVHSIDKVIVGKQDKSLPYTCLYCNRKFARPHEKVKHERIHTGEKPHSCEICGKSFRVSYCLTLHMRTHTGARPYACPHCNKRFKAHSVYNHHLLTHSEVRAYKCPYCPKAFKTSVQLAGHKNSHTKPFSCQQCNRPFASLYAVRVHMEIHSRQNSLKFSCSMCGASYARAFALKDHIKQVHKQEVDSPEHLTILKEEDCMVQENVDIDSEGMHLNKDLPQEINELDIHTDELIVP
nr:zinc finger protein 2-like isoform X1 [Vanessa tameamea]